MTLAAGGFFRLKPEATVIQIAGSTVDIGFFRVKPEATVTQIVGSTVDIGGFRL